MATANTRNIKQISHVRDIVLNGRISPEVQSRLVKDILKFLLYHRDQIPLPYDQLKYYFEKQVNTFIVEGVPYYSLSLVPVRCLNCILRVT